MDSGLAPRGAPRNDGEESIDTSGASLKLIEFEKPVSTGS
jgi:hypothetical protein